MTKFNSLPISPKGGAMEKASAKEYYTVAEAASLLAVSRATIWRWIEAGKLPAYRLGPKNIRIKRTDLETVIRPARAKEVRTLVEREEDIWAGYDPEKVKEIVAKTAGSWADLDTDTLIADLYRAREAGSRPQSRP